MSNHTEQFLNSNKDILLEALKENWASARYHESTRWKYIYYYYAAVGAIVVYLTKEYIEGKFSFASLGSFQFLSISFLSFLLAAIGYAALWHLLYANAEYGNHIRAIEYIARDLGLNRGMAEYREGRGQRPDARPDEISGERSTYMALPLLVGIRGKLGNVQLYNWLIPALLTISFVSFVFFLNKKCLFPLKWPPYDIGLNTIYPVVFILLILLFCCYKISFIEEKREFKNRKRRQSFDKNEEIPRGCLLKDCSFLKNFLKYIKEAFSCLKFLWNFKNRKGKRISMANEKARRGLKVAVLHVVIAVFPLLIYAFDVCPYIEAVIEEYLLIISYSVVFFFVSYFYIRYSVLLKEHFGAEETDIRDPRGDR